MHLSLSLSLCLSRSLSHTSKPRDWAPAAMAEGGDVVHELLIFLRRPQTPLHFLPIAACVVMSHFFTFSRWHKLASQHLQEKPEKRRSTRSDSKRSTRKEKGVIEGMISSWRLWNLMLSDVPWCLKRALFWFWEWKKAAAMARSMRGEMWCFIARVFALHLFVH